MLIIEKLPTRYSEGSASVDAEGTIVTPTGALWYGNVWGDDLFFDPAQPLVPPQRIASVNEDGTLTLAYPWPGDTMTEAPYEVRYIGIIERSTAQTRRVIEELGKISPYYDVQVDTLAERDDYDDRPTGFAVLVADTGDGRSAIYSKNSATSGDWSDPAYVTGPAVTLDVGSVTPVAFGNDPDVTLNPVAGGYEFDFELPENASFQSGTITTLDPGDDATFSLSPVAGGYALNLGVPRGPAGDIDGVTPFWQGRITVDADAAAARAGLGATTVGDALFTAADAAAARAGLGAVGFEQTLNFYSTLALEQAEDRLTGPVLAGPDGNGLFDGFNVLDYVDVAGATNLDTSTAGELRATMAPIEAAFASHYDDETDRTVYTASGVSFGDAAANRKLIIGIVGVDTANGTTIASVSAGGASATRLVENTYSFPSTNSHINEIWGVDLPAGASGDVVVACSSEINRCGIAVVSIYGAGDIVFAGGSDGDGGTSSVSETIDVPSGGLAIAQYTSYVAATSASWTGLPEIAEEPVGTNIVQSLAMNSFEAAQTDLIVTASPNTAPTNSSLSVLVFASRESAPMSVESTDLSLSEIPEWGQFFAIIDLDGATLADDVTASLSRDGSSYVTAPLVVAYNRPNGSVVARSAVVDLTGIGSGQTGRWKLEVESAEDIRIEASGVMFGVND